jgi:CHAD domain-containing protein
MNNRAAHIIRDRIKSLSKHSQKMKHRFDKGAIHKFRVEYKKLRSFLRMSSLGIADVDDLKLPHRVKKIYSVAGKIRDRQLWLDRIKAEKIRGHSSFVLVKRVRKEIGDLGKKREIFLSRQAFEEIGEKLVDRLPPVLSPALVEQFIHEKRGAIDLIMQRDRYTDIDIHSIRKNLKDILYVSSITTNELEITLSNSVWNRAVLEKTGDMADLLGSFHDAGTALSFLAPSEIKNAGENEKMALLSTRRRWLGEKRKLKENVLKQIDQMQTAGMTGSR